MENKMNEEAKQKFIEIQKLFNRMSHELMCVIVESYYIWRTLTFARSIPEVGKEEAEKVAKQMSLYKEFFIPTEQSHLNIFIIGIMKFFDKDNRALSFANLIKQLKENEDIFTQEVLKSVDPHLDQISAMTEDYLPIKQEDIDHFEELKEKHRDLIANLKDIRDKQFAHTDMEVISKTFVPNKIEELIKDVQGMFNKLSNTFDRSSTAWEYMKEDSIRSTEFLLENLGRGEIVRLEEIKKKWGNNNKIKNYEKGNIKTKIPNGKNGWFFGNFPDIQLPYPWNYKEFQMKWAELKKDENSDGRKPKEDVNTISVLVSGGPHQITLYDENKNEKIHLLEKSGDYLFWAPGVEHSWKAVGENTTITFRWKE